MSSLGKSSVFYPPEIRTMVSQRDVPGVVFTVERTLRKNRQRNINKYNSYFTIRCKKVFNRQLFLQNLTYALAEQWNCKLVIIFKYIFVYYPQFIKLIACNLQDLDKENVKVLSNCPQLFDLVRTRNRSISNWTWQGLRNDYLQSSENKRRMRARVSASKNFHNRRNRKFRILGKYLKI